MLLAAILATGGAVVGPHGSGSTVQIEPWQVINLIGAPLLALLFLQPVIDDLRAWLKRS